MSITILHWQFFETCKEWTQYGATKCPVCDESTIKYWHYQGHGQATLDFEFKCFTCGHYWWLRNCVEDTREVTVEIYDDLYRVIDTV